MHYVSWRVFLWNSKITQITQPPSSPDLAPCDFWLFPKLKSPLKAKRFHRIEEIQENMMGQLMMAIGRDCVRSQSTYFEGDWGINVLCTMFLVSSSISVFIFHITCLDTCQTDIVYKQFLMSKNVDLKIEWLWIWNIYKMYESVTKDRVGKGTILLQRSNILFKVV